MANRSDSFWEKHFILDEEYFEVNISINSNSL